MTIVGCWRLESYLDYRLLAVRGAGLGRQLLVPLALALMVAAAVLDPATGAPAFAGCVGVAMWELLVLLRWRRARTSYMTQIWYELSPQETRVRTSCTDYRVASDAVAAVRRQPGAWVLRLRGGGCLVIPRDAFDAASQQQVDAVLTGRRGTPTRSPGRYASA